MPARDVFHDAVKHALEKEGWTITHDPLLIKVDEDEKFLVDLGAERFLGAERGEEKIAVEVKSFISSSVLYEFHGVLGQYLNYRAALEFIGETRELIVAIPVDAMDELKRTLVLSRQFNRYDLRVLVYDPELEEVTEWIR